MMVWIIIKRVSMCRGSCREVRIDGSLKECIVDRKCNAMQAGTRGKGPIAETEGKVVQAEDS